MDKTKLKAFTQQMFELASGAMASGMVYLGLKTGLFDALAGKGPLTLAEIVRQTGLQARYVEEWLKGMTAAKVLEHDPAALTYTLPEEHAYLLASEGTDHYVGGMFRMMPPLLKVAPEIARKFRDGGGLRYQDFDPEIIEANASNAGLYEHRFASEWLPSLPDVVARLEQGGEALDVGCGIGTVSLALAKAFPRARFAGVDTSEESVARARAAASAAGLSDRVTFRCCGVDGLAPAESYDLVTACDCIHDLADPVGTLRQIRQRLRATGKLLAVELKAGDRLEDNIHPMGAMFYGISLFHCMTQSLANGGPGLGNSLGPNKIVALLGEAGFRDCRPLDIRSQVLSFFAASP